MKEQSIEPGAESRPTWESLETFARQGVQRLLRQLLEEEIEGVPGRACYERRGVVDATPGYHNGHSKPRRLSGMTEEVGRLLPELYLHGLAQGDFDLALRGLLGAAAPLSAPSIARLKAGREAGYETWKHWRLDDFEPVYVWADGIYAKAGLEKDKAAILVMIAALRDGRNNVVLAVERGYRESTESWARVLRDLTGRGLRAPQLLIAYGHLGIWAAVGTVFPTVREQRCWNRRLVNVLDTLPKKLQAEARALLTKLPYAETRAEAERLKRSFQAWATKKGMAAAGRRLDEDWERLVTFYAFPKEHWKHLRTTNVVESPFAAVRLRTAAAKRFKKKVEKAPAVIWKTLLVAEHSFRRQDAPERLPEVAEGVVYVRWVGLGIIANNLNAPARGPRGMMHGTCRSGVRGWPPSPGPAGAGGHLNGLTWPGIALPHRSPTSAVISAPESS